MKYKTYYPVPTQVKFYNDVDGMYYGGVAYKDEVICGCCGMVLDIQTLYDYTLEGLTAIEELPWVNISEEIKGEE